MPGQQRVTAVDEIEGGADEDGDLERAGIHGFCATEKSGDQSSKQPRSERRASRLAGWPALA